MIISNDAAGQRVDNFLFTHLKGVPKSMIYRMVRTGKIRINKKRIKTNFRVSAGDLVWVPFVRLAERKVITASAKLDIVVLLGNAIVYEDEHLLILNKPSGIAVHGGSGLSFGVIEALRALRPAAHFLELVHRLDRNTSGVLLIAKKRTALRCLHEQLRMHTIQKDYLALVRGQWPSHCRSITAPLLKQTQRSHERIVQVSNTGKSAETHFTVKACYKVATLVKARPITGRTHQIRVHALHAGHPIAFDDRYGDYAFNQQLLSTGLTRLFLHAASLRFKHPATSEIMSVEAPMDASLCHCLQVLY
ncbi:23S rRNA pseudouridine(955/2504/2580) synthase RluC [Candidatus Gillettellia adelgis]